MVPQPPYPRESIASPEQRSRPWNPPWSFPLLAFAPTTVGVLLFIAGRFYTPSPASDALWFGDTVSTEGNWPTMHRSSIGTCVEQGRPTGYGS